MAGDKVYAGGFYFLDAFDAQTGEIDAGWNPHIDGTVRALSVWGDSVYAGGFFPTAGGELRAHLAAFDPETGTLDPEWNPGADSPVISLATAGNNVYAGGQFTSAGGEPRAHLAAFDADTGEIDAEWNPGTDGSSYQLAASDGNSPRRPAALVRVDRLVCWSTITTFSAMDIRLNLDLWTASAGCGTTFATQRADPTVG